MQANAFIDRIQHELEDLRQEIIHHPVYKHIHSLHDIKVFTQHHIYAVWDFMSLLKSLQNHLTCTSVPWFPTNDRDSRYLINEIVVGEESDVDLEGNRVSHFELYLQAMEQCGANSTGIHSFLAALKEGKSFEAAFDLAQTPETARTFVRYTFDIIAQQKPHLLAAVFTFGREDLIPDMFHSIIADLYQQNPESITIFKYYLDRHIEVDGDHHSHLALQMTANLCGTDEQKWQEVLEVSKTCLQMRKVLWDGVLTEIQSSIAVV